MCRVSQNRTRQQLVGHEARVQTSNGGGNPWMETDDSSDNKKQNKKDKKNSKKAQKANKKAKKKAKKDRKMRAQMEKA